MNTGTLANEIEGEELFVTQSKIQRLMDADVTEKSAQEKENVEKIRQNTNILIITAAAFTLFVIAEIFGAIFSNSISLLGDALAMSIDVFTYLSNIYAERVKLNSPDGKTLSLKSRIIIDIIVPMFSTVSLLAVSTYVLISAIDVIRNYDEQNESSGDEVNVAFLYGFASANLGIDLLSMFLFYSRGLSNFQGRHDINENGSDSASEVSSRNKGNDIKLSVEDNAANQNGAGISNTEAQYTSLPSSQISDSVDSEATDEIDEVNIVIDKNDEPVKVKELNKKNVNMISAFIHVGCDTLRTLSVFVAAIISSSTGISGTLCDSWAAIIVTLTIFMMIVPLVREISISIFKVRSLYKKQQELEESAQNLEQQ
jgi:Co/Zn/Cd efflux system component